MRIATEHRFDWKLKFVSSDTQYKSQTVYAASLYIWSPDKLSGAHESPMDVTLKDLDMPTDIHHVITDVQLQRMLSIDSSTCLVLDSSITALSVQRANTSHIFHTVRNFKEATASRSSNGWFPWTYLRDDPILLKVISKVNEMLPWYSRCQHV